MKSIKNLMRTSAMGVVLTGVIVISAPSGQSNIVLTNGTASHTTSGYSAQVNDTFAGPGEHVNATPAGIVGGEGTGQTATVTVVTK